jgi:hypothetical protein
VTLHARQATRGRPASIAVHDDSDVPRHFKPAIRCGSRLRRLVY